VATLALHQSAWILRALRRVHGERCEFALDPSLWGSGDGRTLLLCWEAFVSGVAHFDDHLTDAATAATYFLEREGNLASAGAVSAENPLSLIGAVALWSGWVSDPGYLREPAVVLRPPVAYEGDVELVSHLTVKDPASTVPPDADPGDRWS
jgi:hypothetical protein